MLENREKIARFHSDFYRDQYHKLLRSLIVMSFVMLALVLAILYFVLFNPKPPFYATTTNGQIIPMTVNRSS